MAGRRRAEAAGLARALGAERVGGAGELVVVELDRAEIVGARQGIVHEAAGDQLAGRRVVDRVLEQRLADALRDAAMDLTRRHHRIEERAEIVDRHEALDLDLAGLAVDLDLADVAAVREGLRRGLEVSLLVEAGLHALRQRLRIARDLRKLDEADAPIGADDTERAVDEFKVARRRLEPMRGERLGLLEHRLGRA